MGGVLVCPIPQRCYARRLRSIARDYPEVAPQEPARACTNMRRLLQACRTGVSADAATQEAFPL